MAGERHDDSDGSDIFWPGYVDATTNLILNLLFLLTILIVAVFMFALELGRTTQTEAAKQDVEVAGKAEVNLALKSDFTQESKTLYEESSGVVEKADPLTNLSSGDVQQLEIDAIQENIDLRQEVKRLKNLLAQKTSTNEDGGGQVKTVEASIDLPKPRVGLDNTSTINAEVMVRFKDEAINFLPEEREQLIASLEPIVASGQAIISVEVPTGFSEAKRIGYYRAMAVRNLLIEMNLPGDRIDVTVLEKDRDANASLVRVQ